MAQNRECFWIMAILKSTSSHFWMIFLDHYYLNETTGLENPTSEAIAKWVFEQLEEAALPGLHAVEIQETCTSGARYMKAI
jgi:6-pyruvoyltetrahydropterin/6-carboxytetrahydropterin synthase